MEISDVAAPDISGGNSGYVSVATLYIFDEGCQIRGTYEVPNCGVPFVIRENFLTQVLTLRSINTDVGSPYFSFDYGDGRYSIRNNQCVCHDESSGLTAQVGCRCGFPVDGTFDN
ncbi:hypothetical protein F5X99DRAFT_385419 [Biscogniauxia marginata]|nr:hypothetical protein F5X99DRAFT_385419 [Biscogniauxia marginata]